jgi:hypothetical protein
MGKMDKEIDPFENFASPSQEDIDVALMGKAYLTEVFSNGSKIVWFKGEDEKGRAFSVGIANDLHFLTPATGRITATSNGSHILGVADAGRIAYDTGKNQLKKFNGIGWELAE